jgi:hypothetical protein
VCLRMVIRRSSQRTARSATAAGCGRLGHRRSRSWVWGQWVSLNVAAGRGETGKFRARIQSVADGWNILTTRPDPAGGPDLRGAFVVRVSHRLTAIAVVQSKMPDAIVQIDSETSPEVF